jgi:hypothetical protein
VTRKPAWRSVNPSLATARIVYRADDDVDVGDVVLFQALTQLLEVLLADIHGRDATGGPNSFSNPEGVEPFAGAHIRDSLSGLSLEGVENVADLFGLLATVFSALGPGNDGGNCQKNKSDGDSPTEITHGDDPLSTLSVTGRTLPSNPTNEAGGRACGGAGPSVIEFLGCAVWMSSAFVDTGHSSDILNT